MVTAVVDVVDIATDHAGIELSEVIQAHLRGHGYAVVNYGPHTFDPDDDYPAFCIAAAKGVAHAQARGCREVGIVLGGSGNGEQIAANKVAGVRAALIWNTATAQLAREHNDANVAALGARQHTVDECLALVDTFLTTPFSGDERHVRRIAQIAAYEHRQPDTDPPEEDPR